MSRTPPTDAKNAAAADRRHLAAEMVAATKAGTKAATAATGATGADAITDEFAAIFAIAPDVEKLQAAAVVLLSAASVDPVDLTIDPGTIREVVDLMLKAYGQNAEVLIPMEPAEAVIAASERLRLSIPTTTTVIPKVEADAGAGRPGRRRYGFRAYMEAISRSH